MNPSSSDSLKLAALDGKMRRPAWFVIIAMLASALAACAGDEGRKGHGSQVFDGEVLAIHPAGERVFARLVVFRYRNDSDEETPIECAFDPILDGGSVGSRRYVASPIAVPVGRSVRFSNITDLAAEADRVHELRIVNCKAVEHLGGGINAEVLP